MTTAAVLTEEYPDECTCNGSEVYFTQKSSRSSVAEITVFANTELRARCALSKLPYSNLAGCLQTRDRVTFKTLTNDLRLWCPRAYDITFDQLRLSTDISSSHGLHDWCNSTSLLHGNWVTIFRTVYKAVCSVCFASVFRRAPWSAKECHTSVFRHRERSPSTAPNSYFGNPNVRVA